MTNMIIEAVVVAFCLGGALGAIVAMHLQRRCENELLKLSDDEFDDELKQAKVKVQTRRIK